LIAVSWEFSTGRFLVDEVLNDCCNDHGKHRADETGLDLLQGREVDPPVCQAWIDKFIENGDTYQQRERVLQELV
jgi:hypothetical protein